MFSIGFVLVALALLVFFILAALDNASIDLPHEGPVGSVSAIALIVGILLMIASIAVYTWARYP